MLQSLIEIQLGLDDAPRFVVIRNRTLIERPIIVLIIME